MCKRYGNFMETLANTRSQQPGKPETETCFVKTAYSTSIQPANLAEENHSRLNLKKRADTQGSVETHPPESQLSEKINKEMNTDIIPREKDKHHKDEPWFPVYSLKKTL